MSSSIGQARAALYALLVAASGSPGNPIKGVQITFGPPDQYEENELVAILGIRSAVEQAIVVGPQPNVRDEQYRIEVAVKCYDPAGTAQSVDARCCAMYEAVREVILTNSQLANPATPGTPTVKWALPTPQDSPGPQRPLRVTPEAGQNLYEPGWIMQLDLHVECKARA